MRYLRGTLKFPPHRVWLLIVSIVYKRRRSFGYTSTRSDCFTCVLLVVLARVTMWLQEVLPLVLRMASDPVPNIRFNVSKTLEKMAPRVEVRLGNKVGSFNGSFGVVSRAQYPNLPPPTCLYSPNPSLINADTGNRYLALIIMCCRGLSCLTSCASPTGVPNLLSERTPSLSCSHELCLTHGCSQSFVATERRGRGPDTARPGHLGGRR